MQPNNPYSTDANSNVPPVMGGPQSFQSNPNEGDGTGGIIPYKNPKALLAYYLGIFSLIPVIGIPLGIAAFVLGILGLRDRARNPAIKGSLHAGIGIGCGGLFALLWIVIIASSILAIAAAPRRY